MSIIFFCFVTLVTVIKLKPAKNTDCGRIYAKHSCKRDTKNITMFAYRDMRLIFFGACG